MSIVIIGWALGTMATSPTAGEVAATANTSEESENVHAEDFDTGEREIPGLCEGGEEMEGGTPETGYESYDNVRLCSRMDLDYGISFDLSVSDAENGLWMIRVHDGVATLLEAEWNESADTVTFSTYALVALGPFAEEKGGLSWVIWLIIAIVVIVALIFIFNPKARAAFKRKK